MVEFVVLAQKFSRRAALPAANPMQNSTARLFFGFLAGFLATLVFHQLTLALLWSLKVSPFAPFPMTSTWPFHIPAVFSLAFWGGVWGVLYALIDRWFPGGGGYWLIAFLFGAIFPSLIAWLVVLPLKGLSMGGGWHPALLFTGLMVNGAWGIGTGLVLRFLSRKPSTHA